MCCKRQLKKKAFVLLLCILPIALAALGLSLIHIQMCIRDSVQITIDPQKIGDVEGKQGKVINKIIEETGVKIDISDDGSVNVCGTDQEMINKAVSIIKNIVTDPEVGMIMTGKVVRVVNFGAFVELAPNKDGMIHISRLADKRVGKVEDVVNIGDEVKVKVIEIDRMGRIALSIKPSDLEEKTEETQE